jgi:hypothetical protein
MNAYELADEFDWMTEEKIVQWCNDVVNMLRQQADRIAELEKQLSQPMQILNDGRIVPVFKELSDEEILEIGNAVTNLIDSNEGWIEFARAILKKASEK